LKDLQQLLLPRSAVAAAAGNAICLNRRAQLLAFEALEGRTLLTGVAVFGDNQIDNLVAAAGNSVTLVTDAQLATPGFLNAFDVFVYTRTGSSTGTTLSAAAAANVKAYVRRTVLLNGDFADAVGQDTEIEDLIKNSVQWAGATHHGYVGEFNGAFAGLTSNGNGLTPLNLIAGAAAPFNASTTDYGNIAATAFGADHPVLAGVALPRDPAGVEIGAPLTGVDTHRVIARYTSNNNPAVIVSDLDATQVAEFGDNQIDDSLAGAGFQVSLVTDAQLATPGFLDDFDVFVYTRNGSATGTSLSAAAAANVKAYVRRTVLLNGDFADAIGQDTEIEDLIRNSVGWAGATHHGYVGEFNGAFAGLTSNGNGLSPLNLIPGVAGAFQVSTTDFGTIAATAFGGDHPVLAGVALPRDPAGVEIGAPLTGVDASSVIARYTATNNPAILVLDQPAVTISDVAVTEGNSGQTPAVFTISLSGPSDKPISITVSTIAGGSATPGADYVEKTQVITFAPGETSQTFTVDVLGDTVDEFDQTFRVALSSPSNVLIAGTGIATGTILDDDAAPTVSINNVSVNEGNSGTSTAGFTVSLSTFSEKPITVDYGTADDTATSPSDYLSASGTLTFAAGETTKPVNVTINGDTTVEPDERFFVNLANASNATLGASQGIGTILNDDVVIVRPTITSVVVNADRPGAQRSMVTQVRVTFSEPVNLTAGAIELKLTGKLSTIADGRAIGSLVALVLTPADGGTSVIITFTGPEVVAQSLLDGRYELKITGSKVSSTASGATVDGDRIDQIIRIFGDADGDGDVDTSDLTLFYGARNSTTAGSNYRWYFDFESNGSIDNSDLTQFSKRSGRKV
jgi:uncharacterized protein YvpB